MVYANLWKLRSLWDENHHHRSLIPSSIVPCPYSPSTESIRLAIVWELISIPIRICQQKMMPLRCSLLNLHDLLFASLLKATRHTLHAQHPLQTILWGFDNPPLTTQQSPQCALLGNLCRGIGADIAITDEDDTTTAEETSEPPTTTPRWAKDKGQLLFHFRNHLAKCPSSKNIHLATSPSYSQQESIDIRLETDTLSSACQEYEWICLWCLIFSRHTYTTAHSSASILGQTIPWRRTVTTRPHRDRHVV